MTVLPPGQSPLARLVLFMICLSVLAGIVAGAHYYTVDLPQQLSAEPPVNGEIIVYGPVGCTSLCNGDPGCIDACSHYGG